MIRQIYGWLASWLMILLICHSANCFADRPEPEYLTVRNGLPQGFINSMLQDQHGFMWFSTRDGLCRYDGIRFRIYTHDPQQKKSLSFSSLIEIKDDQMGNIWVRTENNNIDSFNPVTEEFKHVSNSVAFVKALGRDQISGIAPDHAGNVWVATRNNGFFLLNTDGSISNHNWGMRGDTIQRVLNTILLDRQNRVWLGARDGLFQYNTKIEQFTGYRIAQGLPQNEVFQLHERINGELLLGFPGSFARFNPQTGHVIKTIELPSAKIPLFSKDSRGFDYVNLNRYTDYSGLTPLLPTNENELPNSKLNQFSVQSMLVDRTNVLWLGLNGDGIIKYDLNKRLFQTWPYSNKFFTDWLTQQLKVPLEAIPPTIRKESGYDIHYRFDTNKALWISSPNDVPYRYNSTSKTFEAIRPTGIESHWLLPNTPFRFTAISTDAQGEIWGLLAPHNRVVVRYNSLKKNFTSFRLPLPVNHPYVINDMVVDGGRIYLATKNHGLLQADLSTQRLTHWQSGEQRPGILPDDALLCLAQDPKHYNYLWIGTLGRGLCRLDKLNGTIQQFTMSQGLPNNVIYGILPDKQGHLWVSTNRGLCRFDTRTNETRNYTADDGLPSDEFYPFHNVALPDGRLIFGGVKGYTVFDPKLIREDPFKPVIALTALRINNQSIGVTSSKSPIRQDINEVKTINLAYDQNFLSIDFAALQFNQSRKNQYRYKLVGLDDNWIYSGNQATATYTNLAPKTYTFVVNASNTSGIWSPYTHRLQLVIAPPIWATWWAYSGYALLLLSGLLIYFRLRIRRIEQKSQMALREQEAIQLKNLDTVKTRFFSNITHEFRTPLTLIISPLEQLLKETKGQPMYQRLTIIYRNANRLLRLINELLDLAKLDAGNLSVTTTPGDLPAFVHRTMTSFTEEAERRKIQLIFTNYLKLSPYWFDADKLEKILSNLLSNAIKFTNEHGSITVSIEAEPISPNVANPALIDRIHFSVHNTGISIPSKNLPYVFDRFYQGNAPVDTSVSGSGIGLALVKELVEMMQGEVSVDSDPQTGTTFTVELPCHQAITNTPLEIATQSALPELTPTRSPVHTILSQEDAPLILLVEDDNDIAEYVTSLLSTEWHVRRVENGKIGLKTAIADSPALIISDVLMPEMDGYELCRLLKANPITSHIPVILLTAKVAIESRLEGLNAGADDYLPKPFQVDELLGRVRNRFAHQNRMRQFYRTQFLANSNEQIRTENPVPAKDDFMNKVYNILESQIDDQTLGVEALAAKVGMSRMHLNRKIKAITGITPNELIRLIRLKRASELLLTGAPISEVADRVGFDTPAYFSKIFKEYYHLTPSEYIEKHRQEVA